jgi:ATP synthase protein I
VKHNAKNQQGLYTVKRLLILQLGLTLLITVLFAAMFGAKVACSALLGGLVCVIPNACFGRMVFKHRGARAAKQIVGSFYKGEALKIVFTMILFALVFINYSVVPLAFFLTYIIVQFSHWFAPLVLANKRNRRESD